MNWPVAIAADNVNVAPALTIVLRAFVDKGGNVPVKAVKLVASNLTSIRVVVMFNKLAPRVNSNAVITTLLVVSAPSMNWPVAIAADNVNILPEATVVLRAFVVTTGKLPVNETSPETATLTLVVVILAKLTAEASAFKSVIATVPLRPSMNWPVALAADNVNVAPALTIVLRAFVDKGGKVPVKAPAPVASTLTSILVVVTFDKSAPGVSSNLLITTLPVPFSVEFLMVFPFAWAAVKVKVLLSATDVVSVPPGKDAFVPNVVSTEIKIVTTPVVILDKSAAGVMSKAVISTVPAPLIVFPFACAAVKVKVLPVGTDNVFLNRLGRLKLVKKLAFADILTVSEIFARIDAERSMTVVKSYVSAAETSTI